MPTGTEGDSGGSTLVEERTPSLAEEVGQMFGDIVAHASESPEPASQETGAPPASDDATPENAAEGTDPAGSEGTANVEHAGDPPAVAATTVPDEDDPLKDAAPFTYVVNGETRTAEGIRILGGHGGIIDADALPKLQQRLSERDHLYEQGQRSHQRYQDLERLTTWQTKDAQGQPHTLTGRDGLEAQRELLAGTLAELTVLRAAIKDPETIAALIAGVDEAGQLVLNQREMDNLATRVRAFSSESVTKAKAHFSTLAAPQAPQEASVAEIAGPTVDAQLTQLNVTLPDEDKAFLAEQLPLYVRATNTQERAAGLGSRIVDQSFTKLIQRTAQLRASQKAEVQAATTAASENAKKLAAAALGKRPVAPVAPRVAPSQQPPQQSRASSADAAWDAHEKAAAAALRRRTA